MRFLPVNETAFLVELANLDQVMALYGALQAQPIYGITDIVPAAQTLLVHYEPSSCCAETLAGKITNCDLSETAQALGKLIEIPVYYNGMDLVDVATLTQLTVAEVIERHCANVYTVAFCGFAPGFSYLAGGDPLLKVPRRPSPRTKIPAGSVALADGFSSIYPHNSPGGWQIIGTTTEKMWDLSRTLAARLQPGYRVRFSNQGLRRAVPRSGRRSALAPVFPASNDAASSPSNQQARSPEINASTTLKILTAAIPALFQDLGRFGHAAEGVSYSGALDQGALASANRIVGNDPHLPCLEILPQGFSFQTSAQVVIALTGALCPITLCTPFGARFPLPSNEPIALEPGEIVTLGNATRGVRCYLAVRGGFQVNTVLGSASTDTLAHIGPEPVYAGALLTIGDSRAIRSSVSVSEVPHCHYPTAEECVSLDVVMGPHSDWFTEQSYAEFARMVWRVSPHANRVGVRLIPTQPGAAGLQRKHTLELPSEGTVTGAIQVPHNGEPVLFLADHPLTGGYPVIATVARHHLNLASQVPIHGRIRFRPITQFAEILPKQITPSPTAIVQSA